MTSGKNLYNGIIKISGVELDDRVRIGGILYLEKKFDKGFEEIADAVAQGLSESPLRITKMVESISPFLVALILQRNPEMAEAEAENLINQLELNEFTNVFNQLEIFDSAKNESGQKPKQKKKK